MRRLHKRLHEGMAGPSRGLVLLCGVVLCIMAGALTAGPCSAQSVSGGMAFFLDPSVRASGMGRASAAVFWGHGLNPWANPALAGYERGIVYEWGKTQLVPDLAEDVYLKTGRLTLGAYGIGLNLIAKPSRRYGKLLLDYGESQATDEGGFSVGSFSSYERIESWSAGVNFLEVTENLLRLADHSFPKISRYADLSYGVTRKTNRIFLAPGWATPEGIDGIATVKNRDRGWLVRFTPINTVAQSGSARSSWGPAAATLGGLRIDLAAGQSLQNRDRKMVVWLDADQADPVFEVERTGISMRGSIGLPPRARDALEDMGFASLAPAFTPFLSFGLAADVLKNTWPKHAKDERSIRHFGAEISAAEVFFLRAGHVSDPVGDISGSTYGFGLGFPLHRFGTVRYDYASVPQARVLDRVHRQALTAQLDPIALAGAAWRMR